MPTKQHQSCVLQRRCRSEENVCDCSNRSVGQRNRLVVAIGQPHPGESGFGELENFSGFAVGEVGILDY